MVNQDHGKAATHDSGEPDQANDLSAAVPDTQVSSVKPKPSAERQTLIGQGGATPAERTASKLVDAQPSEVNLSQSKMVNEHLSGSKAKIASAGAEEASEDSLEPKADKTQQRSDSKNFARVWRQLAFSPLKHRWLNKAAHERIEAAIKLAEDNHFGEIVVVIENTLPLWRSLRLDAHERALEVFASERVWDTERNSGVLIYLCLSEQALEIVVDRGLHRAIDPTYWRAVCDKTLAGIKRGEAVRSLEFLIRHVGKALKLFDQSGADPSGNELGNQVIRL